MVTTLHCSAPSKLILSGEHSVLYHCPALSLAVDLKTTCELNESSPQSGFKLHLELSDFNQSVTLDEPSWLQRAKEIEIRYQNYRAGREPIEKVLHSPPDLILIALYRLNRTHPLRPSHWRIRLHSEAPSGRGMGSSAAVIVALLKAMMHAHNKDLPDAELLALATEIESYQHGRSSGLDPATLIQGGLLEYRLGEAPKKLEDTALQAWLIDSGAPENTTGECVEWVHRHHAKEVELWRQFAETTLKMKQALLEQDRDQLCRTMDVNQSLLNRIGVVPKRIHQRIEELKTTLGASAKICGAGSLKGDRAGLILCLSDQAPTDFCQKYGYSCRTLTIQNRGVYCED